MAMIMQAVGHNAPNSPSDVQLVQVLINQKISTLAPMRPLRVDGFVGRKTIAAIEAYQSRVLRMDPADGLIEPGGSTIKSLSKTKLTAESRARVQLGSRQIEKPTPLWLSVAAGEASWLTEATSQDGESELAGHKHNNPKILEYLRSVGYLQTIETSPKSGIMLDTVDETAWCACFVNWCLLRAQKTGLMSAKAKEWLNYGRALETPVPGAITVVYRKPKTVADRKTTASGYHVAFYIGGTAENLTLFGGNQRNAVCERSFAGWKLEGYRWPL